LEQLEGKNKCFDFNKVQYVYGLSFTHLATRCPAFALYCKAMTCVKTTEININLILIM